MQKIIETHSSYYSITFCLLIPRSDEWLHNNHPPKRTFKKNKIKTMQFYSYRLQIRDGDWLQHAGRLYQQYMVDQYAKIEQERLNYLRLNQSTLRAEMYQGAVDAIHTGDTNNNIGRRIILPSSFTGGSRQMYRLYQDAMAIV